MSSSGNGASGFTMGNFMTFARESVSQVMTPSPQLAQLHQEQSSTFSNSPVTQNNVSHLVQQENHLMSGSTSTHQGDVNAQQFPPILRSITAHLTANTIMGDDAYLNPETKRAFASSNWGD